MQLRLLWEAGRELKRDSSHAAGSAMQGSRNPPVPKSEENRMNLKRFAVTAFAISLVVASTLPAIAQTSKGILAGIVRDKTGAVIPRAKAMLASQDKRAQVAGFPAV
jgi:hypothetical protein